MPTSDAERIAAAQAYIDALVSHQADAVPFAPGCTRIEVGLKTGFSGNHLRRSLNGGSAVPGHRGQRRRPSSPSPATKCGPRFNVVTKPSTGRPSGVRPRRRDVPDPGRRWQDSPHPGSHPAVHPALARGVPSCRQPPRAVSIRRRTRSHHQVDVEGADLRLTRRRTARSAGSSSRAPRSALLTTIGRKTGEPRISPLLYPARGEPGHPGGVAGRRGQEPDVVPQPRGQSRSHDPDQERGAQLTAREATEQERAEYWPKLVAMYSELRGLPVLDRPRDPDRDLRPVNRGTLEACLNRHTGSATRDCSPQP